MKNNIIGSRIKIARGIHEPRLTQQDLSEKLQLEGCDIDRVTLAKIETGIRQVTDYEVKIFAKVLNVPIEWLFED